MPDAVDSFSSFRLNYSMKIIFIIDTLTAGGKERRLTELIKGLISTSKAECELVVMSSDIHYKEILDLGIKIHIILRKTKKDLTVFNKLYRIFRLFNPDIVHCWDSMTAVYSVPLCKYLRIKLVNGMIVDSPSKRNFSNKDYRRARITFPFSDFIVGNSRAGLKAYRAPEKKSIVIYNGFNFNRINHLENSIVVLEQLNSDLDHIIGMVATNSVKKDYKTFFFAAQRLLKSRDDILFLAIGKNTDDDNLKELIESKYSKHFRLLGKRSDVESLINVMDICVLSTFTEGISNSIMEYMALGKPVIATSGGGTNEIVIDNNTGFLTNPSDPEDLSKKMEALLNNPEMRQKMGKSGRERILDYFSINSMVDNYHKLYLTVLQ